MSARNIQTDVLVVGGGTAGFGAAVAAGRQGLHVTLLEASSKIGGVMAFCPGMPWGGGCPDDRIIGGLLQELTTGWLPWIRQRMKSGRARWKILALKLFMIMKTMIIACINLMNLYNQAIHLL